MAEKSQVYFADVRAPSWRENLPQKLARLMETAGFGAIDMEGTYENSLAVKELKVTAMELSDRCILITDKTKFSLKSPYRTVGLRKYDSIFTDAEDELLVPYREAGLQIINR